MGDGAQRERIVYRLAMLLLYTNRRRYAPSLKCLARGLGCSERTVRRYLDALERVGWPMPKWRDQAE